jgi:hypothetical protein
MEGEYPCTLKARKLDRLLVGLLILLFDVGIDGLLDDLDGLLLGRRAFSSADGAGYCV